MWLASLARRFTCANRRPGLVADERTVPESGADRTNALVHGTLYRPEFPKSQIAEKIEKISAQAGTAQGLGPHPDSHHRLVLARMSCSPALGSCSATRQPTGGRTVQHSFDDERQAVSLFLEILRAKRKRGYRTPTNDGDNGRLSPSGMSVEARLTSLGIWPRDGGCASFFA